MIEQRYDKNYRQPLYSKRPHDLLAKEKRQENIFSIRTTNPPKKSLHARQNERVSDESERGKCLVGTPNQQQQQQQQQQEHFISPHNMHKIKIYNNSTDNDGGAGCPK